MKKHSRRRFVGQLFAASMVSTASGRIARAMAGQANDGLSELCVIARQPGTLPNAVIDVWTGQIGTVDLLQVPEHIGKVVVWDDVRGQGKLTREIAAILRAIEQYFGIKPNLDSSATAHIGHASGLSLAIDELLHTFRPRHCDATDRSIAVIDLSSSGLTRLGWPHIIPSLRRHYTQVIGIDFSIPDLCELDAAFRLPQGLSAGALEAMHACHYWLLADDESLSGRAQLSAEERSIEFTKLVVSLCDHIPIQPDLETAICAFAKRHFATFGVGS